MITFANDKTTFFDVDETLVMWEPGHNSYKPHKKHVLSLKRHKNRGHLIVVWSAGGHEWALRVVKELGLEDYVDAVMAKPDWWYDDLPAHKILKPDGYIYHEDNE